MKLKKKFKKKLKGEIEKYKKLNNKKKTILINIILWVWL